MIRIEPGNAVGFTDAAQKSQLADITATERGQSRSAPLNLRDGFDADMIVHRLTKSLLAP
jgi:hypothetical protein